MVEMLNKVKGMIIGKPHSEKYYEEYKNAIINTITKELKLNNIFIGYNYNFGHSALCVYFLLELKLEFLQKMVKSLY